MPIMGLLSLSSRGSGYLMCILLLLFIFSWRWWVWFVCLFNFYKFSLSSP